MTIICTSKITVGKLGAFSTNLLFEVKSTLPSFFLLFLFYLLYIHSVDCWKKEVYIYDRELLEPSKFVSQLFGISLIFHCNGVYFLLSTLNLKNCLLSFALKYLKLLLWRKVLKKSHLFKIMDYNFSFVRNCNIS